MLINDRNSVSNIKDSDVSLNGTQKTNKLNKPKFDLNCVAIKNRSVINNTNDQKCSEKIHEENLNVNLK